MNKVFKIRGSLKNYEWGKIGSSSMVAQLQKSAFSDFTVDETIPYAELWMGTHISGPAEIPSLEGMKLIEYIKNHPECLGSSVSKINDASMGLPFLFKVLSVNKALSIQVHPDKESAVKLHRDFPEHYPDDNHKPEMAIAITEFEALCGFRPLSEIKEFFIAIPQMKTIVSEDKFKTFIESPSESKLKSLFTAIMTCPINSFSSKLSEIVKSFEEDLYKSESCQSIREVFLKIASQYPGDIGCFCLFFLNYLKLRAGEAIFLAANEPHAYLFGDCIECMACSDNVVRAGLTPKYKDVQTLCDMLTFRCKPGTENIFPYESNPEDPYLKIYNPPVKEFVIDVIELPADCSVYSLRKMDSASILLVVKGSAIYIAGDNRDELCTGNIVFISSHSLMNIEPQSDMLLFRTHCCKEM